MSILIFIEKQINFENDLLVLVKERGSQKSKQIKSYLAEILRPTTWAYTTFIIYINKMFLFRDSLLQYDVTIVTNALAINNANFNLQ